MQFPPFDVTGDIDTAGEFSDRVVDIQRRFYASPPDGPPATSSACEKYRYRPWYRRWYHLKQETRRCEFASSIDITGDIKRRKLQGGTSKR